MKERQRQIAGRKRAITRIVRMALENAADTSLEFNGELGGPKLHIYRHPGKSEFSVILTTADGEHYIINITKSHWETKAAPIVEEATL